MKEFNLQGKCEICSQATRVERTNSSNAWCCVPCLERMKESARKAKTESNLFGRINNW